MESPASQFLSRTFREVEPLLRSIAIRLCRNTSDANDLVQDTFERALRCSGHEALRNPRSWLVTILHNLFVDRCRALARRPGLEPLLENHVSCSSESGDQEPPMWDRLTLSDVRAALEEVSSDLRRAYEMHVFDGRSYAEIAELFEISRITVGTRLNRARHQLRDVLCRQLADEDGFSAPQRRVAGRRGA